MPAARQSSAESDAAQPPDVSAGTFPRPDRGGAESPLRRLNHDVAAVLVMFVALRLALSWYGVVVAAGTPVPGPCNFELAWAGWSAVPPLNDGGFALPLVGIWQRWDACWYSAIASIGYQVSPDAVAFFPLMPLLMRLVGVAFGGNVGLAGLVVSGFAYVAAGVGIYRLVGTDFGHRVAARTLLYISVFPAAFFLLAPFTESVFLALAVWTLYAARRRLWLPAAVLGALAALTRIQGVLLAIPIAWEAAAALWAELSPGEGPGSWLRRNVGGAVRAVDWRRVAASAVAVAGPVLGLVAFLVYTSSAFNHTPLDAQDVWGGRNFHLPWEVVAASLDWIMHGSMMRELQAINLSALILFSLIALGALRVLPVSYSLYVLPQLLVVATRIQPIPLTSTTRYMEVLFPVFVFVALRGEDRRIHYAWLAISILFLGVLTAWFVRGDFVA